jgi:hypothetical protein
MDFREIIARANQILDEERAFPTVGYKPKPSEVPGDMRGLLTALVLMQDFTPRPRKVYESPRELIFESINYNLLCELLGRLPQKSKQAFFAAIMLRLVTSPACKSSSKVGRPSWKCFVSELPLVAEFCVRNGATRNFLRTMGESNPLPGHIILLRHIEDMIAFNFDRFTEAEYLLVDITVSGLLASAERSPDYLGPMDWPGLGRLDGREMLSEFSAAAAGIREESRKARYLYTKMLLEEGLNLEINQDREAVRNYLKRLGFSETLVQCINEVERLYRDGATPFDLKSCMGHLRSFLENLHEEVLPRLHAKHGGAMPRNWGQGLTYFRKNGVISDAEEKFVSGLYILISDEAVHSLIAEKEYARLSRNVVIEYGLLLLRKLEKVGLK